MITIYTLLDPRTEVIRYVGKTSITPSVRFKQHLQDRKKSHKVNWLAQLRQLDLEPILDTVGEYEDEATANRAEKLWIQACRTAGDPLTNLTEGGDGVIPTEETKKKMSVLASLRHNTTEGRKRQRQNALKNKTSRKEHLAAQMKTPKYKKALSVSRKKQWKDSEYREKMSTMSKETWKDPTIAAKRMVGLERTRYCPKRAESIRKALRNPEVQRRRIETRQRNK